MKTTLDTVLWLGNAVGIMFMTSSIFAAVVILATSAPLVIIVAMGAVAVIAQPIKRPWRPFARLSDDPVVALDDAPTS